MILDEFIIVKWHASNKKYLIEKGYRYTGIDTDILINVSDLKRSSHVVLHVKCDMCGKEKYLSYKTYNKNTKNGRFYGCSNKCSMTKYSESNYNLYGFENPMKSDVVKNNLKNSNLKKFGVTAYSKHPDFNGKFKKTNIVRYGVEHYTQADVYKEKKKLISLDKYGVDSYLKTEEFRKKRRLAILEKYGTENPMEVDAVKKKMRATVLLKYGVEHVMQCTEIKERAKKTNIERYGFEFSHQNKEISEKATNTMIERYGEQWLRHTPAYNANSLIYLDMLSAILQIPIQHALNGGEKKFVKYWVDGYIEQYNICIEWDEKYHKIKKFAEKDVIREQYIKENFGCHIIHINEKEFLRDVDNQMNMIVEKINNIIINSEIIHGT